MVTAENICNEWEALSLRERVKNIHTLDKVTFSTSFGEEDQYLTYLLSGDAPDVSVFTLDTGRVFSETYTLWKDTEDKYNVRIKGAYPEASDLTEYEENYGVNGFYNSLEARQACCKVRKIIPLLKSVAGQNYWISGLRRSQSDNRKNLPFAEYDASNDIIKLYPLADLSDEALENAIKDHNIPVNPLHAQGFKSIGCAPCTRAVAPDEHPRSGRWWWEQSAQECGLHFVRGKVLKERDIA